MNVNQISEQAHNQAILTLTAERQELMYYREAAPQLEGRVTELAQAFKDKVSELEQSEMAHDSQRLLNEQLHEDVKDKDIEIRQLGTKLKEKNKEIKQLKAGAG